MAISPVSGEIVKSFTDEIVGKLAQLYSHKKLNKSLAQNIAITLGRLALINPDAVAVHLASIAKQWCASLRFLKSSQAMEREQAYRGLCYAVARNSRAIQKDFAYFCSAITHYRDPP